VLYDFKMFASDMVLKISVIIKFIHFFAIIIFPSSILAFNSSPTLNGNALSLTKSLGKLMLCRDLLP
jgi:hypothetical protein